MEGMETTPTRRKRNERDKQNPPSYRAQDRRYRCIIDAADRYSLLTSDHFKALCGTSDKAPRKLFHHGRLQRRDGPVNEPLAYGRGSHVTRPSRFTEHALGVTEFMVAQELTAQRYGCSLIQPDTLRSRTRDNRIPWTVRIPWQGSEHEHEVVPDRLYGINVQGKAGSHFCLEHDRGTMPVVRSGLDKSSILRKFLAYTATRVDGILYRRFGIKSFRVLTVTTGRARIDTMTEAYRTHIPRKFRRPGQYLFVEESAVNLSADVFSLPWVDANGKPTTIEIGR